jgi:Arc/MetJ family transcription regulator
MAMRITIEIDDGLLARAAELTGVADASSLVQMGLDVLIARGAGRRLAALGGTEKNLKPIPRRRSSQQESD